jgi:chitinase
LHGGWETKTGLHSGLYRSSLDPTDLNVDASVNLLLRQGVSKDKLIMGIPTYGNAFRLNDPNRNGVGAPASGAGSLKYNQICPRVRSGSLNYRWDDAQKVPYAFAGSEWVGYEDVR